MGELAVVRQFYRFHDAVRRRYLAELAKLPPEELARDRGASYPSLLDIYVHVLDAYRLWFFEMILRADDPGSDRVGQLRTVEEVRRYLEDVGPRVLAYVEQLTDEELDRPVESYGRSIRLGEVLWHMVEEEFQHRGEMNALLWQIDVEPPLGQYDDWVAAAERPPP